MSNLSGHNEKNLIHMTLLGGHRKSYQDLFAKLFSLTPSIGKVNKKNIIQLLYCDRLLFGSIDDDIIGFFKVSIIRAAIGRKTVGVFLRPQSCFEGKNLKTYSKRSFFSILNNCSTVSVFTIVPFSVTPHYKKIAKKGLFDPQFWDMEGQTKYATNSLLAADLKRKAAGRTILVFIGSATDEKGINYLSELINALSWPDDKLFTVVAGKFAPNVEFQIDRMQHNGVYVVNRNITDDEIGLLYQISSMVWSCYSPMYDQASGVFSRSVQFNRIPVVRSGSVVAKFAESLKIKTIELNYGDVGQAIKLLSQFDIKDANEGDTVIPFSKYKQDFCKSIEESL